jgi:hypothetical protein
VTQVSPPKELLDGKGRKLKKSKSKRGSKNPSKRASRAASPNADQLAAGGVIVPKGSRRPSITWSRRGSKVGIDAGGAEAAAGDPDPRIGTVLLSPKHVRAQEKELQAEMASDQ